MVKKVQRFRVRVLITLPKIRSRELRAVYKKRAPSVYRATVYLSANGERNKIIHAEMQIQSNPSRCDAQRADARYELQAIQLSRVERALAPEQSGAERS